MEGRPLQSALLILLAVALLWTVAPRVQAQPSNEDCIGFNPDRMEVKQVRGRWKLVDGDSWILDFADQRNEADRSFNIIKTYGFDSICFVGRPNPSMTYFATKKTATTVIIVRHAEKIDESPDSPLAKMGECRAETLSRILNTPFFRQRSGVSVVFATKFPSGQPVTRTRETVNNYAESQSPKINVQFYEISQTESLANLIKTQYAGKTLLVASHSGTVEQIIQNLGAGTVRPIDNEFNNLFVVTIPPRGSPVLTHLKYEVWPSVLSAMTCE